jgi:hypothetical protein
MAKKIMLILLCLGALVTCGSSGKKTFHEDPVFKDYYEVRDESGQQIGFAVKVSKHEWRLYLDDGGKVTILRDPIFKDGFLIFEEKGGD